MALHFVATSVITSEDGIGFGKEEAIESEELKQTRLMAEKGTAKPLYEQLNELQQKKQEEFESNKKKIFAPPQALDEEDVNYFNELAAKKQEALGNRAAIEEKALEVFRAAQREGSSVTNSALSAVNIAATAPKKESSSTSLPVIVKRKRVPVPNTKEAEEKASREKKADISALVGLEAVAAATGLLEEPEEENPVEINNTSKLSPQPGNTALSSIGLLSGYGSDSD